MARSALPNADPSTVWQADLIEATEVVGACAGSCDPAIVKAFSHRLELRTDVQPPLGTCTHGHQNVPGNGKPGQTAAGRFRNTTR